MFFCPGSKVRVRELRLARNDDFPHLPRAKFPVSCLSWNHIRTKIFGSLFRLHYGMNDALSIEFMTDEQNRRIAETVEREQPGKCKKEPRFTAQVEADTVAFA